MEEQKHIENNEIDWLKKEAETLKEISFDGERLPALKLEENKIKEVEVDASKEFEVWKDPESNAIKKLVPVTVKGEKFIWWLNVRNPVYSQIIDLLQQGKNKFKILQTGTQNKTRYALID